MKAILYFFIFTSMIVCHGNFSTVVAETNNGGGTRTTTYITPGKKKDSAPNVIECIGKVGACDTTVVIHHPSDPKIYTGTFNSSDMSGVLEADLKTTGMQVDENGDPIIIRYYSPITNREYFPSFEAFLEAVKKYYADKFSKYD